MIRHTLIGRLGNAVEDAASFRRTDTHITQVLLAAVDGRPEHGIANVLRHLNELGVPPTDIGIDLLFLATLVHAADTRVARTTESQDTWTREFQLVVPVSDTALWRSVTTVLANMLSFLTGDRWELEFVPRPDGFMIALGGKKPSLARSFAQVNLFSGGLDSLIAAIDSLEGGVNPLFVSHASEGATSDAQTACFAGIGAHHSSTGLSRLRAWISFPEALVAHVKSENTTRGRSFLFIALAAAAGSGLGGEFVLEVPEKGAHRPQRTPRSAPPRLSEHADNTPFLLGTLERRASEARDTCRCPQHLLEPHQGRDGRRVQKCGPSKDARIQVHVLFLTRKGTVATPRHRALRLLCAMPDSSRRHRESVGRRKRSHDVYTSESLRPHA